MALVGLVRVHWCRVRGHVGVLGRHVLASERAVREEGPDDDGLVDDDAFEVGFVGVDERHVAMFWRTRRYQRFWR